MDILTLLYCPCPDIDTARTLAGQLLQERLVACCNLLEGMESHYWWQGSLQHSAEVLLLAKTTPALADAAHRRLADLHPYDCPAILALSGAASTAFAGWAASETVSATNA